MLRLTVLSTVAAFAAFLVFAIPAQADESEPESEPVRARDDDYARNGFYVGGNIAGTWYTQVKDDVKDQLTALGYSLRAEVETPVGLGARVGYRLLPHLAAEAQIQWFTKANVQLDNGENTTDIIKFETVTYAANLKGYLFTGRIQPFALTGVGYMQYDADDRLNFGFSENEGGFAARFGGGIDFYFNRNVVGVVEGFYQLPTGSVDGLDQVVWSVGLNYRF